MRQRTRSLSAQLRIVRGLFLGMAMVLLTASAHTAAHGRLPDASALLLLTAASVSLTIIAMERPRSTAWFMLYAIGVQALLHVLMSTISAHSVHQPSLPPSAGMLSLHLVTAVALGWLLAHGDSLLLRWLAFMQAVLFTSLQFPQVAEAGARLAFEPGPHCCSHLRIAHALSRRGPPASRQ